MTPRGRKHLLKPLALLVAVLALEGCISPQADSLGRYTAPIGGAPVISNETPYSAALRCMGGFTRQHSIKIAVGQIADYTGKAESDGSGRKVTAGAALMAMSALSKAGVPLVERFDTSVAEMELKYANNKLIGDEHPQAQGDFRKIMSGSIPGSDYYIVGGITELNFNIRSENASGDGGGTGTGSAKGTLGGSMYVMNVGLDMRLVNTSTLEVVDVISYQKQIIGRQISAGVFDFLGTNFFDASLGESALEPIQLAVRSVIERAVLEMVTRVYHAPSQSCASPLGSAADPLREPGAPYPNPQQADAYPSRPPQQLQAAAYPANAYQQPYSYQPQAYQQAPQQPTNDRPTMENDNDTSRQNPYRGYGSSDPVGDVRLRGRY